MYSTKTFSLLLLLFLHQTSGIPRNCCSNPNILGQSKCLNGNETILNCVKYLVQAENNGTLQFRGDSFLFDEETEITVEEYYYV